MRNIILFYFLFTFLITVSGLAAVLPQLVTGVKKSYSKKLFSTYLQTFSSVTINSAQAYGLGTLHRLMGGNVSSEQSILKELAKVLFYSVVF